MLALPRDEGAYVVGADASQAAVGAVLFQTDDGEEGPVAYFSRLYFRTEDNYCTTGKELLAVVEALRQFRPFVLGRHFRFRTDHAALPWFQNALNLIGQQARWLNLFGEYNFEVEYRPGYKHGNADSLSQRSCRSCVFCREPGDVECMAMFAGSETDADFED